VMDRWAKAVLYNGMQSGFQVFKYSSALQWLFDRGSYDRER